MSTKRIGIFVDVSNLYYCANKKYDAKIDYAKYYKFLENLGTIYRATAYGAQRENEAQRFISCLRHLGWEPKYKKPKMTGTVQRADWNVGIACDVVRMLDRLDVVVLGSSDSDLVPLVELVQERGLECHVVAIGISKELKAASPGYIELTEDILENSIQNTEAVL